MTSLLKLAATDAAYDILILPHASNLSSYRFAVSQSKVAGHEHLACLARDGAVPTECRNIVVLVELVEGQ